jgi:2,4-dienoyl-CoA reductase-like NADH-dependent reductase (Old Yellow Enzyme family)
MSARAIFEPTRIGTLPLANRLIRSATWEGLADVLGGVTPPMLPLYRELAEGGVGLIISSYIAVSADGRQHVTQLAADHDDRVAGLAELAATVHAAGGVLVGQIVHCGGQAARAANQGRDPVAPSAVDSPGYPERPRALSLAEGERVIADFAAAAARLERAGFDGVQLHAAHGYLLSQFLSPLRNRRDDRWGGDRAGRSRFALEVFHAVRAAVRPDLPILVKLNGSDFLDGSTTEDDAAHLARALAEAGVAAIEVSGGTPGSGALGAARAKIWTLADEAYFRPQARALRAAAPGVPIALVGGLRSREKIEEILAAGDADYFSMSRPLIRQPDLPRRWQRGESIRAACISCSGCYRPARKGEGVRCMEREGRGEG